MADQQYINSTAGGSDIPRLAHNGLYLEPNQSRNDEPTPYENKLADAIEKAYAENIQELGPLVEKLNELGTSDPDGRPWTQQSFVGVMLELGK